MDTVKIVYLLGSLIYICKWTYWIQVKEYRWDRWQTWVIHNTGVNELVKFDLRKPEITLRGGFVLVFGLVGLAGLYVIYWPVAVLGGSLGVWVGVLVSQYAMEILRQKEMMKAKALVDKIKPRVVMVNGSYGKSSTKEFLAQILEKRFRLIKTEGNENTEWGVARRILVDLKPGVELMILEVGAYKKGELARICDMVRPDAVIITGMGPQHIDLFGGMENSQMAEFETVEALKPGGFVVMNQDSCEEKIMIDWAKRRGLDPLTYSLSARKADAFGKVDKITVNGFRIEADILGEKLTAVLKIRGVHFAQNILGALLVAKKLGLSKEVIKIAVEELYQPPKSFKLVNLKSGAVLIDNSYNTNREGFLASLDYLDLYQGNKYLITSGIIELGRETAKIHHEIGKKIKKICKLTWVVKNNIDKYFNQVGVEAKRMNRKSELISELVKLKPKDIVLIEGRIPPSWLSEIKSL